MHRPGFLGGALPPPIVGPLPPARQGLSVEDFQPAGALVDGPRHAFDVFARRPVLSGVYVPMATHMRATLVVDALKMALARRRPGRG